MNGKQSIFQMVPIEAIQHSPFNPRRQPTAEDQQVIELAESIRAVGLIQPISVRPFGLNSKVKNHTTYQIIAGARRFEAAKLAGLDEIAAMVHELDQDDALKITITENLQRSDLTPLEEGRGIASLLASGRSVEEIAADIAKSPTWVRRRAKLANIIERFQEMALADYANWSAAHWELIAHLPADTQEKMSEEVNPDNSLSDLKAKLRYYTCYLHHAVFTQTACAKCDKRSDREADLFAGMENSWDTENIGKARCLDKTCWQQKEQEFIAKAEKSIAKKTGLIPVKVSAENNGDDDTGVKDSWDVTEVEEGTKGAVPAMLVDGEEAGKLIWIAPDTEKPGHVEKEEPTATLEQNRLAHQINAVLEWVSKYDKCPQTMRDASRLLAALMALTGSYEPRNYEKARELFCLHTLETDVSLEGLFDHAWLSVKGKIGNTLPSIQHPEWLETDEENHALMLVLEILGLDRQDFIDEAEKAFPDKTTTKPAKGKKGGKKS